MASQPGSDQLTQRSARVVSARKLLRRRNRDLEQQFLVEGPQAVREALHDGHRVIELYATPEAAQRHHRLITAAHEAGARVHSAAAPAIAALADTVQPQGIVAVCGYLDVGLPQNLSLAVVLDGISDPGNAGTILRTADAAGAGVVVFPQASVDPYNGKCVRSSAGSLFHVPVVRGGATAGHLDQLRQAGLRIFAADLRGETDLDSAIDAGLLREPGCWLFGSEAHGLPEPLAAQADVRVRVPIYGGAESLNLATAAAVCLYASARELRKGEPVNAC
jgi:TrmH family RNA methyltransferase